MKQYFLVSALSSVLLFSSATQAEQLIESELLGETLPGLLEFAQKNNPDLAIRAAQTQAAQANVHAVSEFPDPRIEMELMDVTNTNTSGDLNLLPGEVGVTRLKVAQTIPYWGKRDLRGEIAASKAAQREQDWEYQLLDVQTKIKIAFAEYYQAAEQQQILNENLSLLNSLSRLVESRYGVGLGTQQDALRIQTEITALKLDLVETERRMQTASARLNALLPRKADAILARPESLPELKQWAELESLFAQAKQQAPLLAKHQLAIEQAEKTQDLTVLNRYPDFTFSLRHNRPQMGNDSWDVMFGVDIPLQQLVRQAQEEEAEHQLEAARQQVNAIEARLNGDIGVLLAELKASENKIDLLKNTLLPQANANFNSAQAGYESGQVNFNTLIESEQQVLQTQLILLNTEVSARIQQAKLEKDR